MPVPLRPQCVPEESVAEIRIQNVQDAAVHAAGEKEASPQMQRLTDNITTIQSMMYQVYNMYQDTTVYVCMWNTLSVSVLPSPIHATSHLSLYLSLSPSRTHTHSHTLSPTQVKSRLNRESEKLEKQMDTLRPDSVSCSAEGEQRSINGKEGERGIEGMEGERSMNQNLDMPPSQLPLATAQAHFLFRNVVSMHIYCIYTIHVLAHIHRYHVD